VFGKAVFMDRDGTLIELVKNPDTGKMEPARTPDQVVFCEYALEFMKRLQDDGYNLFIVSNQPDIAKGKETPERVIAVHNHFQKRLIEQGIYITQYYYCFHHPESLNPKYGIVCDCRKPAPGSILRAVRDFNLRNGQTWMVGDKETDIECGANAEVNTIRVHNDAMSLEQACEIIIRGA
jgi:D-glycero-D-manno-heptose 1,7-bisphosphate phosphatase